MSEVLSGRLEYLSKIYNDRWAWGRLEDSKGVIHKISGPLINVSVGANLTLTGEWDDHAKYGKQFIVETVVEDLPSTMSGFARWLAESLPDVGPVRAKQIYEKFGEGVWDILDNDYQRLTVISGITEARAKNIHEVYVRVKHTREVVIAMLEVGFSMVESNKVVRKTLRQSVDDPAAASAVLIVVAKRTPMAFFLSNILPYYRCAAVHRALELPKNDSDYLKGSVFEALAQNERDGHTAITGPELYVLTEELAQLVPGHGFAMDIEEAIMEVGASVGGELYMSPRAYANEARIASVVAQLTNQTIAADAGLLSDTPHSSEEEDPHGTHP